MGPPGLRCKTRPAGHRRLGEVAASAARRGRWRPKTYHFGSAIDRLGIMMRCDAIDCFRRWRGARQGQNPRKRFSHDRHVAPFHRLFAMVLCFRRCFLNPIAFAPPTHHCLWRRAPRSRSTFRKCSAPTTRRSPAVLILDELEFDLLLKAPGDPRDS